MTTRLFVPAVALFMVALASAPVRADIGTIINVTLSGPGKDEMRMVVDHDSAKAGEITFVATNDLKVLEHEMVVIAVKSADEKLPYDIKTQRVIEDEVDARGEVPELKPGATGKITLHLKPGNYLLVCNLPEHYAAGMWVPFTVQ